MKKQCSQCGQEMRGRSDKKFCSMDCKNHFHAETRQNTRDAVAETNGYLHRNREILALLMGNALKVKIDRLVLTRTGFYYECHTGTYLNKEKKCTGWCMTTPGWIFQTKKFWWCAKK